MRRAALLAVPLVATACMGGDATEEPAARYLVFTEAIDQPQQAVWIGDVNGNKMRRLTRGAYGLVSPDGTKIAVSRRAGIFTVDPGGGGEHFVAKGRPGAWLPDSRHLLAVQGKALVSVDVGDGSTDVIERREGGTFSISPDGKSIAYDIFRDPPGNRECWFEIYTARVNGDSKRRLTTGGRSSNPVWGDDGIAFAYRPPGTGCFAPGSGRCGRTARRSSRSWSNCLDGSRPTATTASGRSAGCVVDRSSSRRFRRNGETSLPSWIRATARRESRISIRARATPPRCTRTTRPPTAFTSWEQHAARNGPARFRSTRWPMVERRTSSREECRGQTGIAERSSGQGGTIVVQLRERSANGRFGPGNREEPGPFCIRGPLRG